MITPTQHEKNEWSRMAVAAYKVGWNDIGTRHSVAASMCSNQQTTLARFDALQADYRDWLNHNIFPRIAA